MAASATPKTAASESWARLEAEGIGRQTATRIRAPIASLRKTVPAGPISSKSVVATALPTWTETIAPRTSARAVPRPPARLLAKDLDHQPLVATTVELEIEDGLPGAQVEPAVGDRQHDLLMD